MAGAVRHVDDLRHVGLAVGPRPALVQQRAQAAHQVQVGLFVPAAHVVGRAWRAGVQHPADGIAMVSHVQPIPPLQAVAVDRQRLAGKRVVDHQRDQLFRELPRAVVVRAVRRQHRQAIGLVVGAHQVVAGRLAGGIGAVRRVAGQFGERGTVIVQRSVDFIGGDVHEAEGGLAAGVQRRPVGARGLQQVEGAQHIGLQERAGIGDGAVDVGLGREMDHGARAVRVQQAQHRRLVGDVAVDERVPGVLRQRRKIVQVARVGQLVQRDDRLVAAG
ncbi:hypothetical protein D3C72_1140330 [compost metagenome]